MKEQDNIIEDTAQTLAEYDMLMNALSISVSKHKLDEYFTLIWSNRFFYSMFGFTKDEFEQRYGSRCDLFFADNQEDWAALRVVVAEALARHDTSYECVVRMYDKYGKQRWIKVHGVFTDLDAEVGTAFTVMTDVTAFKQAQDQLETFNAKIQKVAYEDPVTHGDNFIKFSLDAADIISGAAPREYSMAALNICNFKIINDWFGFDLGNRTLKYVNGAIGNCLGEGELVCRAFADTYYVLLHTGDRAEIERRLSEMTELINDYHYRSEVKMYILRFEVGVYTVERPDASIDTICNMTNVALVNSQNTSFNGKYKCHFYDQTDHENLLLKKDYENRMNAALSDGEFVVYYQPKISLADRSITGAEALVRWQNPRSGFIPPDRFIPFFEENQFIIKLDLYVFEQVCATLSKWISQGCTPVAISVNMSRVHLVQPDFMAPYEEIRKRYGISPRYLQIELTESLAEGSTQILITSINKIKSLGYECALDDFGSGYSSLNILKDANFDVLKLDREFLSSSSGACEEKERNVVLKVIELAKALNMQTVAEGVETDCQADFLTANKCDFAQGYRFYRPEPIGAFEVDLFGKEIGK